MTRSPHITAALFPLLIFAMVSARERAPQSGAAMSFSTTPDESVLLLGEPTVARTSHLTQRFFPARKHSANPILRRSETWEGVGPYLWGNRLMQDEKTREFRLWYIAYRYEDNFSGFIRFASQTGRRYDFLYRARPPDELHDPACK